MEGTYLRLKITMKGCYGLKTFGNSWARSWLVVGCGKHHSGSKVTVMFESWGHVWDLLLTPDTRTYRTGDSPQRRGLLIHNAAASWGGGAYGGVGLLAVLEWWTMWAWISSEHDGWSFYFWHDAATYHLSDAGWQQHAKIHKCCTSKLISFISLISSGVTLMCYQNESLHSNRYWGETCSWTSVIHEQKAERFGVINRLFMSGGEGAQL